MNATILRLLNKIPVAFCCLLVLVMGTLVGGALYELLVIDPLWSAHPPESVRTWNVNPLFVIKPAAFWSQMGFLLSLSPIAALATNWRMPQRRKWLLITAACAAICIAISFIYFIPAITRLLEKRGDGLSDIEIKSSVRLLAALNWFKFGLLFTGWIASLRALAIASPGDLFASG